MRTLLKGLGENSKTKILMMVMTESGVTKDYI